VRRWTAFLLLTASLPLLAGETTPRQRLKTAAQEIADAYLKEDYARFVRATHPALVQRVGGPDKMLAVLKGVAAEMKAKNFQIKAYTVGEPTDLVQHGSEQYAIVPSTTVVAIPKATLTLQTFLVGISPDAGRSWTFIDGTETTEQKLREMLPGFPAELALPRKQAPLVEKTE
jgi:hypothetical protein